MIYHLIPDELQILHNLGVFNYEKLLLLAFGIKIVALVLIILVFMLLILKLIKQRCTFKNPIEIAFYIIVLTLMSFSIFILTPEVLSKLCFGRGYNSYLHNNNAEAHKYFGLAIDLDSSFIRPYYDLIEMCGEDSDNIGCLSKVLQRADIVRDSGIYAKIAELFQRRGMYRESIEYFKKAIGTIQNAKYSLAVVDNYIKLGDYDRGSLILESVLRGKRLGEYEQKGLYYKSLIDFHNGKFKAANDAIDEVLRLDDGNSEYYVHKARILILLRDEKKALRVLSRAIFLKKELPAAYFEQAKIYYRQRNLKEAREALCKTLYYDNENSLAYVRLKMLERNVGDHIEPIKRDDSVKIRISGGESRIILVNGESRKLRVLFENVPEKGIGEIGVLEPYGFGLQCNMTAKYKSIQKNGRIAFEAIISLKALRTSRVNLNRPWILNIVFADLKARTYCDLRAKIDIIEGSQKEGRIMLVVTEDLEQTSGASHINQSPLVPDIDPYKIKVDLIDKGLVADDIADKYRVRWSHIIDIGSCFSRLLWIKENKFGNEWDSLWPGMLSFLKRTSDMGHDVQLHIHAYNIPGNRLFRQYFDKQNNVIKFKDDIVRTLNAEGTHGAWASNYISLGTYREPNTRIGSIFGGIQMLEGALHDSNPSYRTIFFRAGEYEFGKGEIEVRKSIIAVRKNGILADSDAHWGDPFSRDFRFFKKMGDNVYYSNLSSINEKATSLLDIGVLEVIPVPTTNCKDYVTPIDHYKHIEYNYNLCLKEGNVRNDVFIIMEMYHLKSINNSNSKWDSLDENYGDWKRINEHFKKISINYPKIEFTTIGEATKVYIDYYTPDLVALLSNEKKVLEGLFSYEIQFLGRDIEVSLTRPHFVSIKPPSYFVGRIRKVNLIQDGRLVKAWGQIEDYSDLEFQVLSKTGYRIDVYLNPT